MTQTVCRARKLRPDPLPWQLKQPQLKQPKLKQRQLNQISSTANKRRYSRIA